MTDSTTPLKDRALAVYNRLLETYGLPEWREPLPVLDELISTIPRKHE